MVLLGDAQRDKAASGALNHWLHAPSAGVSGAVTHSEAGRTQLELRG